MYRSPGPDRQFACMDCGACQASSGVCRACGKDPVLDLAQPAVRDMLVEEDDRLRQRRSERLRYVAVPVSVVVVVVASSLVPAIGMFLAVALPFFMGYVAAMIGTALLFIGVAERLVPHKRRFPYLEQAGQ